ncbi:335_t:CDS:2, partial [Cetraspora pellucida]
VSHAFFWEVTSSRSQVTRDKFFDKCGARPSFFVEQIVIKAADPKKQKGDANVLEKDLLLWTLDLQEKIANAVVMYPSQLSDTPLSTTKQYSLSDFCFKSFDSNNTCLIHSPLEYWSNNVDHLSSDPSILKTLSRTNKTSRGMIIPLNSIFGNVMYDKKQIVSADSIILTYFLKYTDDYNEGQTIAIWEAIWQQVMDGIGTNFYLGGDRIISVNMNNQGELKHLSFRLDQNNSLESSAEWALLLLAYLIFFLYIIISSDRLNFVMSKFGLAFSTVAQVFASLIMSLSICSLFGVTLTLVSVSWKLLPFVFILVGVENMFILSNAVTAIPMQLNVKERVARGLEKVGYSITKTLIIWLLLLLICSAINIESIQEFCIFTSIAMIIDYMLQMSFFIATLSIDLERLELEMSNLFNNRIGEPDSDDKDVIPLSKTINYGRRIGSSLVVLIFLVAVTNVYQSNIDLPPLESALSIFGRFFVVSPDTRTNVTYWETSRANTADKFWGIVNPDEKNQIAEIRPARHLTLSYEVKQEIYDDVIFSLRHGVNWKLITNASIKAFIWVLKFTIVPATGIAFAISFLVGFLLPEDMVIRAARLSKKSRNNVDKIILPASSSFGRSTLCVTTPRVVTLRGHHLADVDLLCANLRGIIVTTAADRHITSWNGRRGMPLKKLERYMRRCESCKCSSTGGMKSCITWPVRAMCMNENIEILAAGFEDGVVRVWDINSGQATYILKDTVEDVEQVTSSNGHSVKERVTCLQIIAPTSRSSIPNTPTHEHGYSYSTSKSISDQKIPAILLATYRSGYLRGWDLVSGKITHTVDTNQKGGISCLFVVDDSEQNHNGDELRIFTGARDGSVKCWVRIVNDLDNESNHTISDCNEPHKSIWKLLYTIPGEFGNAITSVAAKVVKTQKSCFGIVVTGTADGEVRVYDYLTGKFITRLSYGISEKQRRAKEREEQLLQKQLLFQRQQNKTKNYSRKSYVSQQDFSDSDQDWSEEYDDEYEFWDEIDEIEDCVSHEGAITNIIIRPLKEESCPCGNTEETGGFSITTSSVDEKVYFWQLIRSVMDCTCMTFQLGEPIANNYESGDATGRFQKVAQWDGAMTKFLGRVSQPGGSAIIFLRENIIGVRRVKNSHTSMKRCHGAEGEWEVWILDINYPHVIEPTEDVDNLKNHDNIVEFKEKEILYKRRENAEELKGFVRRRRDVLENCVLSPTYPPFNNHNQNHSQVHNNEEDSTQGQVVDFRQRSQRQRGSILHRVYPNNNNNDRKLSSFEEEDDMNEMLPFSYVRQIVKVGEDGVAIAYGNFVKVVLFDELNDRDSNP